MVKAARDKICVLDLDGVVFDVSYRLSIAEAEARGDKKLFWQIFLREDLMDLDKPREAGIEAARRCLENGHHVLFLTGRPERLLEKTIEQIQRVGIKLGGNVYIIMRPSSGTRARNSFKPPISIPRLPEMIDPKVFKLKVLDEISKIYDIAEIHEDDEEILREAWKRYHNAKLYLHIDNWFKPYRGRRLF